MWSDNETTRDFLNFRTVARTVAEMIVQASGRPLSLGVSGGWGVGKSSMIRLIQEELSSRQDRQFIFVQFNAWLYQGYDDARAALMEVIAREILKRAEEKKTGVDKAKELLGRVNWVRAAGVAVSSGMSMAMGLPPVGLLGTVLSTIQDFSDDSVTQEDIDGLKHDGVEAIKTAKGLIKPKKVNTPPKQIEDLRAHFRDTLKEMDATLVVLIDDLDRCLPPTAIATLEAIRLFLFLENTAFVIAADDKMIRQAVRAHFKDVALDDDLVTNYFDKLIQVPIRVPPLGTQDVRAYLMLLFIENSEVAADRQDAIRIAVCKQLGETWQGKRVDKEFVLSQIGDCTPALKAQIDLADRIAPLMTTAQQIAGNPRLIKRFLNTLSIRLATAKAQSVTIDETVLAKMLLFERCGNQDAYTYLVGAVNDSDEGKPSFLKSWEEAVAKGEKVADMKGEWDSPFVRNWLALAPAFSDIDLRAVVYVSREHLPIITAVDQLSSEAVGILAALLEVKTQESGELTSRLRGLPTREVAQILEKLLAKARHVQDWGTPPILFACLTVTAVGPKHEVIFAQFLRSIPPPRLKAPIVPLLADRSWASDVLKHWTEQKDIPGPVKKAITQTQKKES